MAGSQGGWGGGNVGGSGRGATGWEPALREVALRLERLLAEPVRGVPRAELRGESAGEIHGLAFVCELEPLGEPVGVVWRGDLAAGLARRMMGGGTDEQSGVVREPGRVGAGSSVCSPMEAKLLERLSGLVLREVAECLGVCAGLPLRAATEVVAAAGGEANATAGLWGWSLELAGPGFRGELQCLLPGCLAEFRPLPEGGGLVGADRGVGGIGGVGRGGREAGGGGAWVQEGGEYEVVLAELELTAAEWAGLAEGDLLVTEREAGCEVEVRGAGGEVWRGEAGVWEGSRVVRVLGRVDE